MNISILGISYITEYVIEKIINYSDNIKVFSEKNDYNFENKYKSNKSINILKQNTLEDQVEKISKSSDVIFLLSESDPFNSFSYEKIINNEPNKKIIMYLNDKDIYEMYKEKNYSVITYLDLENYDFSYLVKE
jgi:UDP-glucose 6-dehydrogenase|tara:strand:+ start:352 stop:750 length:399 start_codon:yes stop_codon:yes gene_type:complete